jgi:hypothetical protein
VAASISCVAKGCVSMSPFNPRVFRISLIVFRSFSGICSAFRVEVGCTSIALYVFSSISLFSLIALKVSFSWGSFWEALCSLFLSFLCLFF